MDEPVTPELALVDPELARRARRVLPDLPGYVSSARIVRRAVQEVPATVGVADTSVSERRAAAHGAQWLAVFLLGIVSVAAGSLWFVGVRSAVDNDPDTTARSAASLPDTTSRGSLQPRDGVTSATGGSTLRTAPTAPPHAPTPPSAGQRPTPPTSPPPPSPEVVGWVPVPRATHYRVEFYRGRTKIFEALPAVPRLELPRSWRYAGRAYRFDAGRYTWVVRPGFGPRARARYGRPIVRATLRVPAASG